jgi:hypothetical protein
MVRDLIRRACPAAAEPPLIAPARETVEEALADADTDTGAPWRREAVFNHEFEQLAASFNFPELAGNVYFNKTTVCAGIACVLGRRQGGGGGE